MSLDPLFLASATLVTALALAPPAARGEGLVVNPDAGRNTFSAVFDARLGERITAVSSEVGCEISYDPKGGTASGKCSVPLESVRVDNDDTKSDHFRQWATNKKVEPKDCRIEATFAGVAVGKLVPEKPVPFSAEIPFTVCGRGRADGGREKVTGTALLFPAGSYGAHETIRIRAVVAGFDRVAYRVGPQFTEGWLARVQALAPIVAQTGTLEISLFAKAK